MKHTTTNQNPLCFQDIRTEAILLQAFFLPLQLSPLTLNSLCDSTLINWLPFPGGSKPLSQADYYLLITSSWVPAFEGLNISLQGPHRQMQNFAKGSADGEVDHHTMQHIFFSS